MSKPFLQVKSIIQITKLTRYAFFPTGRHISPRRLPFVGGLAELGIELKLVTIYILELRFMWN